MVDSKPVEQPIVHSGVMLETYLYTKLGQAQPETQLDYTVRFRLQYGTVDV